MNKSSLSNVLERYSKREVSLGRAAELAKIPLENSCKKKDTNRLHKEKFKAGF